MWLGVQLGLHTFSDCIMFLRSCLLNPHSTLHRAAPVAAATQTVQRAKSKTSRLPKYKAASCFTADFTCGRLKNAPLGIQISKVYGKI